MFEAKVHGAIAGAAVGDALGGTTEGFSPQQIQDRYGGFVEGIEGPFHPDYENARPISPFHKGDGHITDDTLMTESLISIYEQVRDHLDAFDFAKLIIPELIEKKRFIPELHKETLLIHRVFFAEKWLVQRLHFGHVDPREAGVGNMVNCGAAMYLAPVGVVNAGNPWEAYKEGIEIAATHQSSFGREAAGVFAACVAHAFTPKVTVNEIVEMAIELANDGTKKAIQAVYQKAKTLSDWKSAINPLREAFKPYDTLEDEYRQQGDDARKPSRLLAIEELPIALGMLVVSKGSYREGVLGGVNYGRDSDSIATMTGAISGALNGVSGIPSEWLSKVEKESRRDFAKSSALLTDIAIEIQTKDKSHQELVSKIQNEMFGL
ncbi:MAG: ADP-ribosylglycohydrolase family protein [Candidatus Nanopelagicaceae bacterium]|nr:ADP-ribosylglycohydrolase family protein [Candidatus Nanopelagicaceae bacterium]